MLIEAQTQRRFRFNNQQLYEFTQRFESMASNGKMSYKQYRESLGLFGMESLSFMADRMFTVMDRQRNSYLQLQDYLSYIDVMMYGDEEERLV